MRLTLLCLLLTAALISACKKDEENPGISDETRQFNDDSNTMKSESDQADNDISSLLPDYPIFGRVAGVQTTAICGVSVDTTLLAQKIIFLDFDSTVACLSPARSRSGRIKVELTQGNYWRDPGSVLTITFLQYKVKRLSNGKSVTLNGVKTLTNINGHNWLGFLAGTDTLRYRSRALSLQVNFSSGLTATWNVAQVTEWRYNPSLLEISFSSSGDTTISGLSNTASWGTNRFQKNFITAFNAPVSSNSTCGFWKPVHGDVTHKVDNSRFDITLGVDQNGGTSSGCPYGYQVAWYYNSNSVGTAVFPY